jgi:quercetin dioxygenase-like cupin family protein
MDAGACVCLSGSCVVSIDQKQYTVNKGDLFTVFPTQFSVQLVKAKDLAH